MPWRLAMLAALLAITVAFAASEPDKFVFEIWGRTSEEDRHAMEEAFGSLEHIESLEVNLFTKELTVRATHGKYPEDDLERVIDSTDESDGPMKGTPMQPKTSGK